MCGYVRILGTVSEKETSYKSVPKSMTARCSADDIWVENKTGHSRTVGFRLPHIPEHLNTLASVTCFQ